MSSLLKCLAQSSLRNINDRNGFNATDLKEDAGGEVKPLKAIEGVQGILYCFIVWPDVKSVTTKS